MGNSAEDVRMWDEAAARYQEIDSSGTLDWRRNEILRPTVLSILGDVAARDALDAGCGPGWLSLELVRRGARVIGIDASAQMLGIAAERARSARLKLQLARADLCRPLPLRRDSFDVVLCHMVLMDIPDIHLALAEFARVLRPSGRLVLSITHPCFFPWLWEKDATGKPLWKPVDDYLTVRSEIIHMCGGPTRHYHRPLSHYLDALRSAGFVLDTLLEPVPMGPRRPEIEHAWRLPDFVVMRALPRHLTGQESAGPAASKGFISGERKM